MGAQVSIQAPWDSLGQSIPTAMKRSSYEASSEIEEVMARRRRLSEAATFEVGTAPCASGKEAWSAAAQLEKSPEADVSADASLNSSSQEPMQRSVAALAFQMEYRISQGKRFHGVAIDRKPPVPCTMADLDEDSGSPEALQVTETLDHVEPLFAASNTATPSLSGSQDTVYCAYYANVGTGSQKKFGFYQGIVDSVKRKLKTTFSCGFRRRTSAGA